MATWKRILVEDDIVGEDPISITDGVVSIADPSTITANPENDDTDTLLVYDNTAGVWTSLTLTNLYSSAFAGGVSGITSDDIADGSTTVIMTTGERSKLTGIEAGAEVNVNADWNAASGDAQILNKPTIPTEFADLSGNTDDVPEGQTNKYYTDTRVQTYLTSQKIRANYPSNFYTGNTLITSQHEQTLMIGKASATMQFAVSAGLSKDCEILVMQDDVGSIIITGAQGVTILTSSSFHPETAGRYAIIGLKQIGVTNTYVVTGERKPV